MNSNNSREGRVGLRTGTTVLAPLLALAVGWLWSVQCLAQGTTGSRHITFDGPPRIPAPETGYIAQLYEEAGFRFTPIDPNAFASGFVRAGTGGALWPDNGTAYLQAAAGHTLKFSSIAGLLFDLVSVELAEYSTVVPDPVRVHIVGFRPDGTQVTVDVTTDGVFDGPGPMADFETFTFDSRFRGLTRVEIPTMGWSLDNLRLNVPEPGAGLLLLLGAGLAVVRRR